MPASPSVQNYTIGKGIVSFQEAGSSTFIDLGNAPSFVCTTEVEKKPHYSSREGIKTKDFSAITQVGATVKFTLDEITGLNVSFHALGDQDTTVPGVITIDGLTKTEFVGELKLVGTNEIGQKVDWLGTVSLSPEGELSLITDTDEFSTITLTAEVQKDATTGAFGKWTIHDTVTPATATRVQEPVDEPVEAA